MLSLDRFHLCRWLVQVVDGQDVFQDGARPRLVCLYSLVSCAVNFVVRNCASCLWLIGISGAMLIDWVEAVDGIVDWIELALW